MIRKTVVASPTITTVAAIRTQRLFEFVYLAGELMRYCAGLTVGCGTAGGIGGAGVDSGGRTGAFTAVCKSWLPHFGQGADFPAR